MKKRITAGMSLALLAVGGCASGPTDAPGSTAQAEDLGDLSAFANTFGLAQSASTTGDVDRTNPFFASLGTNGRTCDSCHRADQGWTLTPAMVQQRFDSTDGTDPLFAAHDGANAPNLDVSTVSDRQAAYSLLLKRAVIRIGLPVKATSEFELLAVDDPYNWASSTQLSLFRRPLPTTNLGFLSTVNWDGRNIVATDPTNITLALKNQSNGATVNHAKAAAPIDDATRTSIVTLESSLFTGQIFTFNAEYLDQAGGGGGPVNLAAQPFALGANDPLAPGFDRRVFTLFDNWQGGGKDRNDVYQGQEIFNTKTFTVHTPTGDIETTCSGCHATPNVGAHPVFRLFDVGVSAPERRSSDVPLYTFRNLLTGEQIQTTDPGRALISGLWADMNKFKVPSLRGLAARAPYFHDGSAATIRDVVDHYQRRFNINLRNSERRDLIAFLSAL